MAPVASALLSVFCNNSFLTPSSPLAPLGNIEVSQLSDLGYAGARRSNGPDDAQAEIAQLVSTARRIPIRSGSDIMGNDTRDHLFDLIVADPIRDVSPLAVALSPARSKSTLRNFALATSLVQSMAAAKVGYELPYRV
ncbi:hypothetical protein [Bradyrhizobium sp. LMG 9283]|uniref:hypothetical protein n=1 Tax=Bradyrhizobium sp. LMG 9283 TaxID=592064 RepID=UPI00388F9DE3